MADTTVTVILNAQDKSAAGVASFTKGMAGVGDITKGVASGILAAGGINSAMGALTGSMGYVVKSAMDYEKTMSGVKAVSGATADEMKGLSGLALQLGKDTVYSASQAGQGIEELVKGGVSISDIMNGAARATLNLASAGGVELAEAAELAANAANMFGISGEGMAHVADVIAGAANASSLSVTDFRFAMQMSGSVAHLVGQDFDDLGTAIAVMGAKGLKGSDAGTSLKTMLMNLQPQTKQQKEAFQELGLAVGEHNNAFINADGTYKHMNEISEILHNATKNLTAAEREKSLEVIFGTDAVRAAAIMSEAGAEGFDNMAASMHKVTAEAVAAERLNNLAGDVEQLKGSVETAAIMLGGTFSPTLREATQDATGLANEIIELESRAQGFAANGMDPLTASLFAADQMITQSFGPDAAFWFEKITELLGTGQSIIGSYFRSIADGADIARNSVQSLINLIRSIPAVPNAPRVSNPMPGTQPGLPSAGPGAPPEGEPSPPPEGAPPEGGGGGDGGGDGGDGGGGEEFAYGGVVPGPYGARRRVTAHGGEVFLGGFPGSNVIDYDRLAAAMASALDGMQVGVAYDHLALKLRDELVRVQPDLLSTGIN